MNRQSFQLACQIVVICGLFAGSNAWPAGHRTVVATTPNGSGPSSENQITSFRAYSFNDSGQVSFVAMLGNEGSDEFGWSLWSEGNGQLRMVANEHNPVPGKAGAIFDHSFPGFQNNSKGQLMFSASYTQNGLEQKGIWVEYDAEYRLIANTLEPAPGAGTSALFYDFGTLDFNDLGQVAVLAKAAVRPTPDRAGIWVADGDLIRKVAWFGDPAPGTSSGIHFNAIAAPQLANDGTVAFIASLNPTALAPPGTDSGIWADHQGDLRLVARAGASVPRLANVKFSSFPLVRVNDPGQIYFVSRLSGSGVNDLNNESLWIEDAAGELRLVLREGDPAPGMIPGSKFGSFLYSSFEKDSIVANANGDFAFSAQVLTNQPSALFGDSIWTYLDGRLGVVARIGDPAPGTPPGVQFSHFREPIALNDFGQVAFSATLSGPDIYSSNMDGIWATDRTGQLRLIARTGDTIEVAPGDFRKVSGLSTVRNEDLNSLGQLAFSAGFYGASGGIFVSNIVAIPEPSSANLTVVLLILSKSAAFRTRAPEREKKRGKAIRTNTGRHDCRLSVEFVHAI